MGLDFLALYKLDEIGFLQQCLLSDTLGHQSVVRVLSCFPR